jgi:glycine/D-amino acid oxidase-like deaminating enzyme/nitrite reductase/ring-hydroxylating ferredoxin subunit
MNTRHRSYWLETTARTAFPRLDHDVDVDVAIVGGGITGLTAAILLQREGRTVAVVEAAQVAEAETGLSSAHLATHHDLYYDDTIHRFGESKARLVAESRKAALDRIESLAREHMIACDFERVPGYLYELDEACIDELLEEAEACMRVGIGCEFVPDVPGYFETAGALRFRDQAQLHPRKYVLGLAHAFAREGGLIYEHTRVTGVEDGRPCRVVTDHGVVHARHAIVAANVPVNNRLFLITKIASYRSYVIGARIPATGAPYGLFWDTLDPYHYVRVHMTEHGPLLIVGGEDHKTGKEVDVDEHWTKLEDWTRSHFRIDSIDFRWSGQIIQPADGLPYIGRNSLEANVLVATGYAGDGLTNGTIAAMLCSDLVAGRVSPWAEVYDATRIKAFASAREYIAENLDFPAHLVGELFKSPETHALSQVPPGEGRLVQLGKERLAIYKTQNGTAHAFSPVCPHMGCHVTWNAGEKSWDCPCHGSRFACDTGEVLNGPAVSGLSPKSLEGEDVPERPSHAETIPPRDSRESFF